jgi:adenosine deaminase
MYLFAQITNDSESVLHIEPKEELDMHTHLKMYEHIARVVRERDDFKEVSNSS